MSKDENEKPYVVDQVFTSKCYLFCPKCGERIERYSYDPRNSRLNCDSCGTTFVVPENVEVVIK